MEGCSDGHAFTDTVTLHPSWISASADLLHSSSHPPHGIWSRVEIIKTCMVSTPTLVSNSHRVFAQSFNYARQAKNRILRASSTVKPTRPRSLDHEMGHSSLPVFCFADDRPTISEHAFRQIDQRSSFSWNRKRHAFGNSPFRDSR